MYELKRSKKICEQIKLGDELIEISLDAGAIHSRFIKSYRAVEVAEDALKDVTSDNMTGTGEKLEAYGNAVAGVLQVVFGEENTQKILSFYEGNFIEMFGEIYPLLTTVIMPKINEVTKRKSENIKALYRGKK
jgi:hypothetical protein